MKKQELEVLLNQLKKEDDEIVKMPMRYEGFELNIKRNLIHLSLLGYIKKQNDEPFEYEEIEVIEEMFHGGITYQNNDDTVFGFDCATSVDILPGMERDLMAMGLKVEEDNQVERSYKDKDFVLSTLKDCADNINKLYEIEV